MRENRTCGGFETVYMLNGISLPGYYFTNGSAEVEILIKNPNAGKESATFSRRAGLKNKDLRVGVELLEASGFLYGTISRTLHTSRRKFFCNGFALKLPEGFSLVPPGDPGLRTIAQQTRFGTNCLVMSDGTGVVPFSNSTCNRGVSQVVYNSETYFTANHCPSELMMRKLIVDPSPQPVEPPSSDSPVPDASASRKLFRLNMIWRI